jgi:hypothetical protein
VINQAIGENRFGEYLLYTFAAVFVGAGVAVLIAGLLQKEGLLALAGGIAGSLFWPAMESARKIRKENIAIRLIEYPLGRAESAREAAIALREFFSKALGNQQRGLDR